MKAGLDGYLSLSDETLAGLGVTSREIVDAITQAILGVAAGTVLTAPKSALLPGRGRYLMSTLSTSDEPPLTVVKTVTVAPDNPGLGLEAIEGAIFLHDSGTGRLVAVMGSGWVTAVRTAGLSAVAAERLANPRSRSIAFIGCGVQARSHLEMFADLYPIEEIRAFGRGQANIDRLCALARSRGIEARQGATAAETIQGADLIVTSVTLSFETKPFVDPDWVKPGAFASIIDAAVSWLPERMDRFSGIIVDDEAQEKASANKMVEPSLIAGDITGLVAGDTGSGFDPAARRAYVWRGLAVGDFAIASLAYARAVAAEAGHFVQW